VVFWGDAVDSATVNARLRKALEARPEPIVAAYLFGSVARGTDGPHSDLDVGVLLTDPPMRTLAGLPTPLIDALERATDRRVDLVILNNASADLVHRVLRDGHLLLERDRSARIAFEVRRRNEYFDLLPILERYRQPKTSPAPRS